jgi:hypothetical protein
MVKRKGQKTIYKTHIKLKIEQHDILHLYRVGDAFWGFYIAYTRLVPLVEQELPTLPEFTSSF